MGKTTFAEASSSSDASWFIAVRARDNDGAQQSLQNVATGLSGYSAFRGNATIRVDSKRWQRFYRGRRQNVAMQRKELIFSANYIDHNIYF